MPNRGQGNRPRRAKEGVPGVAPDTEVLRSELAKLLRKDYRGKRVGSYPGIYAFYDYDREPIYVGQTLESLGARVRRHLTNQRTDAVAMKVLDPFEVAYVKLWPFHISGLSKKRKKTVLNHAEYTVYRQVLEESKLKAVLNEVEPPAAETIELPEAMEERIVPDVVLRNRQHPDVRIARRAATIGDLAKVVSEREVSKGLRRTLCTQARRLLDLAQRRFADVAAAGQPAARRRTQTG